MPGCLLVLVHTKGLSRIVAGGRKKCEVHMRQVRVIGRLAGFESGLQGPAWSVRPRQICPRNTFAPCRHLAVTMLLFGTLDLLETRCQQAARHYRQTFSPAHIPTHASVSVITLDFVSRPHLNWGQNTPYLWAGPKASGLSPVPSESLIGQARHPK